MRGVSNKHCLLAFFHFIKLIWKENSISQESVLSGHVDNAGFPNPQIIIIMKSNENM